MPDFSGVMSYRDWLEIKRSLRFEDHRREDELKAAVVVVAAEGEANTSTSSKQQ